MRKILGLPLAIFLLIGFGCHQAEAPQDVVGEATLIINNSTGSPQNVELEIKEGATAFDLLNEGTKRLGLSLDYDDHSWTNLGIWIEGIGGVKNNALEGKYWLYYVNGEMAPVAVDKQEVKVGDKVEFRYAKVL